MCALHLSGIAWQTTGAHGQAAKQYRLRKRSLGIQRACARRPGDRGQLQPHVLCPGDQVSHQQAPGLEEPTHPFLSAVGRQGQEKGFWSLPLLAVQAFGLGMEADFPSPPAFPQPAVGSELPSKLVATITVVITITVVVIINIISSSSSSITIVISIIDIAGITHSSSEK
ncbi:unnamed protein product [Rangifer tarandus platyrhynchus]|uniref:Uncharacterized protein n=2 Tax=Rangifer tarandus platyrhynchus TaxID=3082113 RepID=A0ABN9A182_RANTA|nr:unnamed protein product [Rangifer tarandus platyrhynchus]